MKMFNIETSDGRYRLIDPIFAPSGWDRYSKLWLWKAHDLKKNRFVYVRIDKNPNGSFSYNGSYSQPSTNNYSFGEGYVPLVFFSSIAGIAVSAFCNDVYSIQLIDLVLLGTTVSAFLFFAFHVIFFFYKWNESHNQMTRVQ